MNSSTDPEHLPAPPWRIAVDVGGTFTDMVLVDADGRFHVFKTPSVPADPSRGVLDVLEHAARAFGADVERLLSACTLFLHGSTVATNTVLEGSGARVGMLVTRGFRDFLEARRGFRADPFDHRPPYPPVLVPRYLRLPVGGRMDARGSEVEPLDETDLDAAIETFRAEEVESIAVCLLHSFENGAHERRCAEVLRERGGFDWVSLSHAVVPVIGEYERGSTTVVNAYIGPKVVRYLQALDERLRALGLGPDLLVLQSNGRAISTRQVAHCPVNLVLSGPAGGVGALDYFAAATRFDDLITMEIGGTSCDVMLRAGGRVAVTDRLEVGGYDLVSASVDIHTVGAGGGTIAGADAAGLLYAGPRGAGAVPGPAAYGRGGEEPTVTDAQLVLGRLAPGPYAGGAVSLDLARAETALRTRVAEPLGIDTSEAAIGVIRLVEQNLLQAVERISTERGRTRRGSCSWPAEARGRCTEPRSAGGSGRRGYWCRGSRGCSARSGCSTRTWVRTSPGCSSHGSTGTLLKRRAMCTRRSKTMRGRGYARAGSRPARCASSTKPISATRASSGTCGWRMRKRTWRRCAPRSSASTIVCSATSSPTAPWS